jgi:fructose-bisphosphate aldolase, class II
MLANPKEILNDSEKNHYAIAGINATSLEGIMAIIEAAEELDAPVMLSHAQHHEHAAPIDVFGPLFVHFATRAKVPVIIHLDHGVSHEYVMKAVRNGFTSIMYDCAHLPFEQNIRNVKAFTEMAHPLGITVEAEVGQMPSNVIGQGGCTEFGVAIENIRDYFTKPDEAAEFVRQTDVDMLTVSFGTVHGLFVEAPELDIALLKHIKEKTGCALVMHGSTGVDDAQILEAIDNGLNKINYYTGMGTAPTGEIETMIRQTAEPVYYHDIAHLGKEIMKKKAKEKILLFQNKK